MDLRIEREGRSPGQLTLNRPLVIAAGFAGRDQNALERHFEELAREGIRPPQHVPEYYPLPSHLLAGEGTYDVVGARTSGEAEPVLIVTGEGRFLAVGSDHTDRSLEKTSIPLSKLACPKLISSSVWPLEDIEDRLDDLALSSWSGGALYQQGTLAQLLPPSAHPLSAMRPKGRDLVLFLGTLPVISGTLSFDGSFSAQLSDPRRARRLELTYRVEPLAPAGGPEPS